MPSLPVALRPFTSLQVMLAHAVLAVMLARLPLLTPAGLALP
jgi:hypothetical protein